MFLVIYIPWVLIQSLGFDTFVSLNISHLHLSRHDPDNPDNNTDSTPFVSTVSPLPNVAIEILPLYVDIDLPAYGTVRQSMPATVNLYNRTSYSQEVDVNVEPSEAFMFAGQKQVKCFELLLIPPLDL